MAFGDIATGATTGATLGGTVGSIVPGIGTAIGTAAGGLIGGGLSALLGKSNETPIQKRQRQLIDQLLSSLEGNGPYSDLFNASDDAFQKSYVEPAKAMFKNQIAPQIQQSYIQSGQQRGTGLEDQLARSGVDIDQLLNQAYMNYQQSAQNRQSSALSSILGQGAGGLPEPSFVESLRGGVSGYLSGEPFQKNVKDIFAAIGEMQNNKSDSLVDSFPPPRKGYENENPIYNPYTGIQSYGEG